MPAVRFEVDDNDDDAATIREEQQEHDEEQIEQIRSAPPVLDAAGG